MKTDQTKTSLAEMRITGRLDFKNICENFPTITKKCKCVEKDA